MAETPKSNPDLSRTGFSFERRHDLPGDTGDFYDKAGEPTQAFKTAHDAQIQNGALRPLGNTDPGGETWANAPKKDRLRYSDPHPPYALPAKQAPDENRLRQSGTQTGTMSRDEFQARRRTSSPGRSRGRSPGKDRS